MWKMMLYIFGSLTLAFIAFILFGNILAAIGDGGDFIYILAAVFSLWVLVSVWGSIIIIKLDSLKNEKHEQKE